MTSAAHSAASAAAQAASASASATAQTVSATSETSAGSDILTVTHLTHSFGRGHKATHALKDISFAVRQGETLGLVGESGSGKSTTGRIIVGLYQPTSGQVLYQGRNVTQLTRKPGSNQFRRDVQMVFQDPHASLDSRMTIGAIIAEGPRIARDTTALQARVHEALDAVGLSPALANRYPHELSGGQRQRVGIARALILKPRLIVLDEPISALDVSIQAQVVNLLDDLKKQMGLTYLFIAHDLAMVRHVSDRIAVMHQGRLVELGPAQEVYSQPRHPYTRALISAMPVPDPCAQFQRAPFAFEDNSYDGQQLAETSPGHWVLR